jgi:1-phosphatidylinositol phosphodiesterase
MKTRFDKLSETLAGGVSRRDAMRWLGGLVTLQMGSNNLHSSGRPMKNHPCGFLTRWISVFVLLLVAHNGSVLAHNDGAYCHDARTGFQRLKWMSYLSDFWLLSNISMVGTHDTMSFHGLDSIQTQSLPLSEQLNAGVRALDIRLARVPGGLALHHGVTYQTADFDDVLRTVVIFLSRNPSETVLMRVSSASESDEKAVQAQALLQPSPINVKFADKYYDAAGMRNNMLSFSEMFMQYLNNPAFAGRFYQGPVKELSLGSVRGKILLLRDFSNQVPLRDGAVCPKGYTTKGKICDADFGLDYRNRVNFGTSEEPKGVPWFIVQDAFNLKDNWELYGKWIKVKTMIDKIDSDVRAGQLPNGIAYFMNYLSASGGVVFPYFVASGHSSPATGAPRLATGRTTPGWKSWEDFPRVNCLGVICTIAFEGTNTLAANHISSKIKKGLVGIMMADFPGQGLIDAVIALNFEGDQSANAMWKK